MRVSPFCVHYKWDSCEKDVMYACIQMTFFRDRYCTTVRHEQEADACETRIADCECPLEIINKEMIPVLKIRLQGTKKDIRWFLKGMERDSRYEVENISTFKPCDGDSRFRRLYVNVRRKEKKKQNGKGVASGVKT